MLNYRFAASKPAGHCRHAAAGYGEKRVYNALSRNHRVYGGKFFFVRSALSHGPFSKHTNGAFAALRTDNGNGILNGKLALFYGNDLPARTVGH